MRLLTDTCSAIKLAAFGEKLFVAGTLKNGDLILHPRVFNEVRRWPTYKKEKYKVELEILSKIKATPNLRPNDQNEVKTLELVISAAIEGIDTPIGSADRDQLASALHLNAIIVTNDGPFAAVAEVLEVEVYSAEKIVLEAITQEVITKAELSKAKARWETNNEKLSSKEEENAIKKACK